MRDLVDFLARQLVDRPEEVRVTAVQEPRRVRLELCGGPGDLGKVIGREGRTARALRTVLAALAARHGARAILDIRE
ncbi:MAG: KH domain-containing protein [Myxococcota bacterium]|nr:KH domain-containing protein [Myxococcota bacterium]